MSTNAPHTPGEFGEPPAPAPATGRGPAYYAWRAVKALASLQLTVALFGLGILLIFFGTLAQLDYGIWTVVDKYFWSWVVDVPFNLFSKFLAVFWKEQFEGAAWKGAFPFPAGKLLGGLMLANLLAAHAIRFRLTWKRAGVFLIHGGLILLFVGEFVTREYAVEQRMTIDEGQAVNFTEDSRFVELTLVDKSSDPQQDVVSVVPQSLLKDAKGRISHPDLPADVEVVEFMVNSRLEKPRPGVTGPADRGMGKFAVAVRQNEVSGVDPNQKVDMPAAYVKLYKKGTDESLGTFLASLMGGMRFGPDEVDIDGKKVELSLRFRRYYKPYSIVLDKFRFDRYTGTEKARNYSSDVRVFVPGDPTPVVQQRIAMNEPLRYAGETFYQSSFDEKTEKTTILQVVKNPGWLLPYASCAVVSFGLILHFMIYLVQFLRRGAAPRPSLADATPADGSVIAPRAPAAVRYFPWAVLGVLAVYLLSVAGRMNPPTQPVDLDAFGRMVVMEGGRAKPLDTAARTHLRAISGREEVIHNGQKVPALQWYLELIAGGSPSSPGPVWSYEFVRIDNEMVLAALELKPREGLRYTLKELGPKFETIQQRAEAFERAKNEGRKPGTDEGKFLELRDRLGKVMQLAATGARPVYSGPLLLPPYGGKDWESLGRFREQARADAGLVAMAESKKRLDASGRLDNLTREDEQALVSRVMGVELDKADPKKRSELIKEAVEALRVDPAAISKTQRLDWLMAANAVLSDADRAAVADALQKALEAELAKRPAAATWEKLINAFRDKKAAEFSAAVAEYRTAHTADVPDRNEPKNLMERLVYAPFNTLGRNKTEVTYNRFAPFYLCSGLYAIALVLTLVGFTQQAAGRPDWAVALRRAAGLALLLTLAVHTVALLARMYLMERAGVFVTNLYSSAVFIGWGGVLLGLAIESVFKLGVGNLLAAILGLATSIVGHNLAIGDDTMEMMQAVLDTNFWLATHVTTITLGYTATFVAGFLGALYVVQMLAAVVRDSFQSTGEPTVGELLAFGAAATGSVAIPLFMLWFLTSALDKFEVLPSFLLWTLFGVTFVVGLLYAIGLMLMKVGVETTDAQGRPLPGQLPGLAKPLAAMALTTERSKTFGQMVYGVVCFATLLSFVGTVLGGIWADQSWGRFWGWDPKENGAVLIVLWNSLILHARWAGLIKDRGMAVLAIFGNVITAWSWFGTNQLGIGLHAYGFDSRLADGCFNFWVSQMLILGLGLLPSRFWKGATRPAMVLTARTPVASASEATPAPVVSAAPAPVATAPVNGNGNGNGHHNGTSKRDRKHGKRR
jgi:ABC-type transport system involved in cytochrome c biogenesis permease subunit